MIMLVCIKGNEVLEQCRLYTQEDVNGDTVKVTGVEGYFNEDEHFCKLNIVF